MTCTSWRRLSTSDCVASRPSGLGFGGDGLENGGTMETSVRPGRLGCGGRARAGFTGIIRGIRPTIRRRFPFPGGLLARRNRCR
jgi:hypothetical protein